MEHAEAINEGVAEKYLLHELTLEQAEAFEAHLFECRECADDLKVTAEFMGRVRHELRYMGKESALPVAKSIHVSPKLRRDSWLSGFYSPRLAAATTAVLLGFILYQNRSLVSNSEGGSTGADAQIVHPLSLIGVNSRGHSEPVLTGRRGNTVLLTFDIPAAASFAHYSSELHSPTGRVLWQVPITEKDAQDTVSISVSTVGWDSGQYTLIVRGSTSAAGSPSTEVARYTFTARIKTE